MQQFGTGSAGGEVAKKVLSREFPGTSAMCKAKLGHVPTAPCADLIQIHSKPSPGSAG